MVEVRFETCLPHEDIARIAASPAVEALAGRPRYDIFMHPETSAEEWINALDCDYDNRTHLFKTAYLAHAIAVTEGAPEEAHYRAVLTGFVHDAAEAVLGDVNFHDKTDDDEEAEIAVLDELVENGQLHLSAKELQIVRDTMRDKKDGPTTVEGRIFDLSEYKGYLLSGLTGWDAYEQQAFQGDQAHLLRVLGVTVVSNNLPVLMRYQADGFQSPGHVLESAAPTIDRIMAHGQESDVLERIEAFYMKRQRPEVADRLTETYHDTHKLWLAHRDQQKSRAEAA